VGGERETWDHVWEGCRRQEEVEGGWQENVRWVLGDEGEGEEWMRRIERERMGEREEGRLGGVRGCERVRERGREGESE